MSKPQQKRFYSITNHNRITVAHCSNLKVAIDWVNTHPSRALSEVLLYNSVYHIIRKSGKYLFTLGGLEAAIVESQLLYVADQAHSSQVHGSVSQSNGAGLGTVSELVDLRGSHLLDDMNDDHFILELGLDNRKAIFRRLGLFRALWDVKSQSWLCYSGFVFVTSFTSEERASEWVESGYASAHASQVHGSVSRPTVQGSGPVSELVDLRGSQLLELGKLGCRWQMSEDTLYTLVYLHGGCIYGGYDLSEAIRIARERVTAALIESGRVA